MPGITAAEVEQFLDYVFRASNLVPFVRHRRPSLRDPDDERILEVAIQCQAMIVTHNKRDFALADRFGVTVASPAEFLNILREGQ